MCIGVLCCNISDYALIYDIEPIVEKEDVRHSYINCLHDKVIISNDIGVLHSWKAALYRGLMANFGKVKEYMFDLISNELN